MEKVHPWCGRPSDRGRLKNRTELNTVLFSNVTVFFCNLSSGYFGLHVSFFGFIIYAGRFQRKRNASRFLSVCLSGCLTRRVHTPSDSQGAALTWPVYVSALLPECCHKQVISFWKCVRNNDTVEMENYKKITCGLSKRAISDDLE